MEILLCSRGTSHHSATGQWGTEVPVGGTQHCRLKIPLRPILFSMLKRAYWVFLIAIHSSDYRAALNASKLCKPLPNFSSNFYMLTYLQKAIPANYSFNLIKTEISDFPQKCCWSNLCYMRLYIRGWSGSNQVIKLATLDTLSWFETTAITQLQWQRPWWYW